MLYIYIINNTMIRVAAYTFLSVFPYYRIPEMELLGQRVKLFKLLETQAKIFCRKVFTSLH